MMSAAKECSSKVFIIILNYNGWEDTIECLESVFRLNYLYYKVILVDNNSTDDSIARIRDWADGELEIEPCGNEVRKMLCLPPGKKPISILEHQADRQGNYISSQNQSGEHERLIVLRSPNNLGYAGGNNIGIRYALNQDDCDYIWILNNDTIVHPDSLDALVNRIASDKKFGMCGSKVLYYYQPDTIQALGGAFLNKWTRWFSHIGEGLSANDLPQQEEVEAKIDYVLGASMLVSAAFIREVGLMNEKYFLFSEEIDWALRAKGKYRSGYAPDSVVYHKEGASFRTSETSLSRFYYLYRNHFAVTYRFLGCWNFFLLLIRSALSIIKLIIAGDIKKALMIIKAIRDSRFV